MTSEYPRRDWIRNLVQSAVLCVCTAWQTGWLAVADSLTVTPLEVTGPRGPGERDLGDSREPTSVHAAGGHTAEPTAGAQATGGAPGPEVPAGRQLASGCGSTECHRECSHFPPDRTLSSELAVTEHGAWTVSTQN